jgi:putative PIN family toxin of toxin-antitoxin system
LLKVVLDTSVFVSAILSKHPDSAPSRILENWKKGEFTLVISPQMLEELVIVLLRRGISETDVEDLVAVIVAIALQIPGAYEATLLDEIDPDDNKFIAAAYESNADYIVSLDAHLLNLKHSHGTQIVQPALFLKCLDQP